MTDNKTYAVLGKCTNKLTASYYVMTHASDPLSPAAIKDISAVLKGYGFNEKFETHIKYDKCPKPKPAAAAPAAPAKKA